MSVDIQTTINYGREIGSRIYYEALTGKNNIEYTQTPTLVHDARPLLDQLSMEKQGFVYLTEPSKVSDWDSEDQIKTQCYAEAVQLAKRATGARSAVVFDHTLRRTTARTGGAFARDPVSFVHLDYTDDSGPKRLQDFFGPAAANKVGRWAICNVWVGLAVVY